MGCSNSKDSKIPSLPPGEQAPRTPVLPKYLPADPDLGWRNISAANSYPTAGFLVSFQNDRSGNLMPNCDLISIAINIAQRAAKLADKYGVVDVRDLQSSTNILKDLDMEVPDVQTDMRKILKYFGCPDYGWILRKRTSPCSTILNEHPEIFASSLGGEPPTSLPAHLQIVDDADGKCCVVDIPEIGVNIAEQLYRLEKSETVHVPLPLDCMFGWKTLGTEAVERSDGRMMFAVAVSAPDGRAFMLVPEELIMHVCTWVQQTYLTTPVF